MKDMKNQIRHITVNIILRKWGKKAYVTNWISFVTEDRHFNLRKHGKQRARKEEREKRRIMSP